MNEEKNSTSAFLWKAAISTISASPSISANLLLKCKKALNETNIGVKFKKVSKRNMCQSCGNPWTIGKYNMEVNKSYKTAKIKKILRKKASAQSKRLNRFEQHMIERYTNNPSSLVITCETCSKKTSIPIAVPPKEDKRHLATPSTEKDLSKSHAKKAKKKENKATNVQSLPTKKNPVLSLPSKSSKSTSEKAVTKPGKKNVVTIKKPTWKQPFSKSQLKNISKNLKKTSSSSLQAFLNSVK